MPIAIKKRIPGLFIYPLIVFCFVAMGCSSDNPGTPQEDPPACDPLETIDFGLVTVGSFEERSFEIANTGGGTLNGYVSVSTSAPCDGFSIMSGGGAYDLSVGQIHTVVVRLEPASTGVKSCRIETGNSLCGDLELAGTADVPATCEIQPTSIDLGVVTVGSVKDTTFTIINTGGGVLSGAVTEACNHFSIQSGRGAYDLSANESLEVTVRFSPVSKGSFSCVVNTGNEVCDNVSLGGVTELPNIAGTAVGHEGTILRTTDGGATWVRQSSGTTSILIGVSFTDVNTGTAVGENGLILRTTDGGETWTPQVSGESGFLTGVWFTDENNGTVVTQNGVILRTTDGGAKWDYQDSGVENNLNDVMFVDANTGVIVGWDGLILRTSNGGTTWTPQSSGTTEYLARVWFVNANVGVVVGGPKVLSTTDGGSHWRIKEPYPSGGFNAVVFTDELTGTIVGWEGALYRTGNGGTSWLRGDSGTTAYLNDLHFVGRLHAIAVGSGGTIIQTTDAGSTWIRQDSGISSILRGVSLVEY
ncbi:MAG: choice-of-anchor D domain-containing protein [Candidatus Latescibacterota bacterium]|nr:MAG: choice-of-anchor D domain-containing protein [Candidatus Latescibacterota bacterium]